MRWFSVAMINANDIHIAVHDETLGTPPSVDLRTTGRIAMPATQGVCGSCYAIAATQALQDRLALAGKTVPTLSFQMVTDCSNNCVLYRGNAKGCSEDCAGGFVTAALEYLSVHGTVAETQYPQKHKGDNPRLQSPDSEGAIRTVCTLDDATKNNNTIYKADGHYGVTLDRDMGDPVVLHANPKQYSDEFLKKNAKNIAIEIALNGPVCATFNMFSDFPEYIARGDLSEPYYIGWNTPNLKLGRPEGDTNWTTDHPAPDGKTHFVMAHAVSLIGYGTSRQGKQYWLVRNSWGGTASVLKFARNINAASIEGVVEAPAVRRFDKNGTTLPMAASMVKPPEDTSWLIAVVLIVFVMVVLFVVLFLSKH